MRSRSVSAESVLRCGLLKQHRQLSYEELAFHLEDLPAVPSLRPAARCPGPRKKSVLHMTICRHPGRNMGGDQSASYLPARVRRNSRPARSMLDNSTVTARAAA